MSARIVDAARQLGGIDIAYLNAHATGTKQCDAAEADLLDTVVTNARAVATARLTARQRSACDTQPGFAHRRTWSQMSKSVASTQRGSDPDVSTRWVARGSRGSRCPTAARSASSSNGSGPGSRTISFSVCPVMVADSSPRMRASSSESRSQSSGATSRVY